MDERYFKVEMDGKSPPLIFREAEDDEEYRLERLEDGAWVLDYDLGAYLFNGEAGAEEISGEQAVSDSPKGFTCAHCGLRRYHLPGQHDQCDHSPTGECEPVEPGQRSSRISVIRERAFTGQPKATRTRISKQETGEIGERLAMRLTGAKRTGHRGNNFPIDLVRGDVVYEIKAGLVSNRADAQKWRLTIGEPGVKEKAWLAGASDADKTAWNDRKERMILERKQSVLRDVERQLGRRVRAKTLTFIVDPDRKTADMFEFDGFHPVIRWRSPQAARGYRRTVRYG